MCSNLTRVALALLIVSSLSLPTAIGQGRDISPVGKGVQTGLGLNSVEFWDLPPAAQYLLVAKPGACAATIGIRPAAFYGAALTIDINAEAALDRFWIEHGDAFGIDDVEVVTESAVELAHGAAVAYASKQHFDGLPVEYSSARVLVEVGQFSRLKYAAARFAPLPAHAFPPITISADEAIAMVRDGTDYGFLSEWSKSELVVFAGEPEQWASGPDAFGEPVRAWKFRGEQQPPVGFAAFTFFVDAASGALVRVRDELVATDVIGTVVAKATPGMLPDTASNPAQDAPLPDLRVQVVGGNNAYSDANGNFTITHGETTEVTVSSSVSDGRWVNVNNGSGSDLSANAPFTPGDSGTLRLNNSPTQFNTAQANLFVHVNKVHAFFKTHVPTWTRLEYPLVAWANSDADICNAFFSGTGIVFAVASGNCVNTAYSSVIAHETGHWVVSQLGLAQRAFGEGFADTCSTLLYDDPIIGRDYQGSGTNYRNYSAGQPEKTYPCSSSETHECGKILAGFWWDIRENSGNLADTQKLFANWMQVTNGGVGPFNSAHPLTLIEILTVDDTPGLFTGGDGNLSNGTPHCAAICPASVAHGIACDAQPYCDAGPPAPPGTNRIISFYPPQVWKSSENGATGVDPFGIAVGDLNADSKLDVVLACENSNNVLVYIGQTSPGPGSTVTFAAPVAYAVGTGNSRPAKVVLADMAIPSFAPDGKLDIVVTLQANNAVEILHNDQGSGTFPSNQRHTVTFASPATVLNPVGLAIADWDGNGRDDIAVAGYQTGGTYGRPTLGLGFAHNSDGTFAKQVHAQSARDGHGYGLVAWVDIEQTEAPTSLHRLTMTEFDINIVPPDSDLFIFKHTSGQSFTLLQRIDDVGRSPDLTIGEFNHADTRLDIALAIRDGSDVKIFKQLTNNTFDTTPTQVLNIDTGSRPQSIASGFVSKKDTNPVQLDVYRDIVTVRDPTDPPGEPSYDPRFDVLVSIGQDSNPYFDRFWFANSPDPNDQPNSRCALVIDLNGDGFPDVVTSNAGALETDDQHEGFSVSLSRR